MSLLILLGDEELKEVELHLLEGWYYYKDFYGNSLSDPMNFVLADRQARKLSNENESGLAEVVVYRRNALMEVATYLRGTKRYQGKKSRDAQRFNRPPTT